MFFWESPAHHPVIAPVEVPPRAEHETVGVRTDVYPDRHEPAVWIWVDSAWTLATIRAQHRYPDGVLELQVCLPNDIPARERTYRWGPGVLLAHPGHRATRLPGLSGAGAGCV